jgi:hypothetical protein
VSVVAARAVAAAEAEEDHLRIPLQGKRTQQHLLQGLLL